MRAPRQGVTRADADALPAAEVADAVEEDYRRDGTVALSAIRPPAASREPAADPRGAAAEGRCGQVRDGGRPAAPHRPPPRRRREAPQAPPPRGSPSA